MSIFEIGCLQQEGRTSVISLFKKILSGGESELSDLVPDDPAEKIRIATCAILVEIAGADNEFSASEQDRIIDILTTKYQLTSEEAVDLIEIASEEIKGSIDLYRFTRIIAAGYSLKDRIEIMEAIWSVVYADGELSRHEDSLVHKLSYLLGLSHKHLIDAKLKVLGRS